MTDHHARHHIDPLDVFGLLHHLARIGHDQPGDAQQFPILGFLLVFPLLGGHALDLLHAALRAAGAIGKPLDAIGQFVMEISHQTRDGADRVPQ